MVLDSSNSISELCKCFDFAIEKTLPKAFIKMRMASLYSKISGDSLSENFASLWFSSLFTYDFSTCLSMHMLDMFLLGGWEYAIKMGLALMKLHEGMVFILAQLLKAQFEDVFQLCGKFGQSKISDNEILKTVKSIDLRSEIKNRINRAFEGDSLTAEYAVYVVLSAITEGGSSPLINGLLIIKM